VKQKPNQNIVKKRPLSPVTSLSSFSSSSLFRTQTPRKTSKPLCNLNIRCYWSLRHRRVLFAVANRKDRIIIVIQVMSNSLYAHGEQEVFTLPEHLISPLVFTDVHVVLSFVSPYFLILSLIVSFVWMHGIYIFYFYMFEYISTYLFKTCIWLNKKKKTKKKI